MKFRYLTDPLFLACVVLYFVNRWVLKPYVPNTFSQNYLNDLILIPFWVPIMLFGVRCCRLREDKPPTAAEVVIPLVIWSVLFELILPEIAFFKGLAFADHLDILFYTLGALVSLVFWKAWYEPTVSSQHISAK